MDFERTTPTLLPEALRDASRLARRRATDPLNRLDYNPYIANEWSIVAEELRWLAESLERRFQALFAGKDDRNGAGWPRPGDGMAEDDIEDVAASARTGTWRSPALSPWP